MAAGGRVSFAEPRRAEDCWRHETDVLGRRMERTGLGVPRARVSIAHGPRVALDDRSAREASELDEPASIVAEVDDGTKPALSRSASFVQSSQKRGGHSAFGGTSTLSAGRIVAERRRVSPRHYGTRCGERRTRPHARGCPPHRLDGNRHRWLTDILESLERDLEPLERIVVTSALAADCVAACPRGP